MAPANSPTLQPVTGRQRIDTLDILRGFALFGVLAVNLYGFGGYTAASTPLDRVAAWLREFLLTGKSYSLFALLFGLGMALQRQRAEAKGQAFVPFFLRRCLVLLGIGVLHAVCLWWGDILTAYALLGILLLLLFRDRQPGTLLFWVGTLLALPTILYVASGLSFALSPDPQLGAAVASSPTGGAPAELTRIYTAGSLAEITAARAQQALEQGFNQLIFAFPNIFSMLLLGLVLGKWGAFTRIGDYLFLFRRLAVIGFALGIPTTLFVATVDTLANPNDPLYLVAYGVQTIAAPLLMLGYLGGITLLVHRGGLVARLLGYLAPMGKLALTIYITQSIILNFLFYSFGLALYGRTGAAANLALALAIYPIQVVFSNFYVRWFRFGPVEWLWRSLTYGKRQPFRTPPPAPSPKLD